MQYPSIIRANNLCYSTMVLDEKYSDVPGVEYYEVATGMGTFRFAQDPQGVVPALLEDLAIFRKTAKKGMAAAKAAGDAWTEALFNGKQLAYKITMNSVYGFMGATKGMLPCVPIAASVTATGRAMIQQTKEMAEKLVPGSRVIYGDSVASYTPCIVRSVDGLVNVTTFEDLAPTYGCDWEDMGGGKESSELRGVDVWSDDGWTAAERVIRHRAGKPMVRVVTHTGVVDVTEDHSLLRDDGTPVAPRDLHQGDALLHAALPPPASHGAAVPSEAEARILGFFFGDGSAGAKASWALNNADMELLEEYKALCEEVFPEYGWCIMPSLESSGVYKLSPRGGYGTVVALVNRFRRDMYHRASKVIPPEVFNAPREIRLEFWRGMYDADGDKDTNGYVRIDQKSQLSAAHICLLAESLGFKVSVNTRADKEDIYRMTMTTASQRKDPVTVKKLYPIEYGNDEYVYDVTTRNHHFSAGVGRLVAHNTDSVMVILNVGEERRHDLGAHFEVAARLAAEISATFKHPNELEFEKCYYPYLLFSKKRYAGETPFFFWEYTNEHSRSCPGRVPGSGVPGRGGRLRPLPPNGALGIGRLLCRDPSLRV